MVHTDGRSFVRCLSEIMDADDITCTEDNEATCTTCAIQNMGECRMVRETERERVGFSLLLYIYVTRGSATSISSTFSLVHEVDKHGNSNSS